MVPDEQGFFHRARGDLEVLKKENVNERYGNDRKDQGIDPFYQLAVLPFPFFPESPVDLACDIQVEDHDLTQKPPEIIQPDNPKDIQDRNSAEFEIFVSENCGK